jgi:hypothetical protein
MRARVIILLLAFWTLALPGFAQDRRDPPSLDRVLPQIRRTTPGQFYDAEGPFIGPNGQASYRIKWMTPDGRIIWFYADARTGQVFGGPQQGPPTNRYPPSDHFRSEDRFRNDGPPPGGNGNPWNGGGGGRDWDGRGHGGDWNGGRGNGGGNGGGDHGGGHGGGHNGHNGG